MKNLKKILSLTLALAMALSLMTTALAKDTGDFADGDDVSYAEAVDVMATIGVFNGTGDGSNFDPNGNLTREQAAKIITYMVMGQSQADQLVATIAPFADVSADRWSAGAIAYCASEGIMNGTGSGKFNPTGELTGLQFAKMLLVALGYDADIEEMTGTAWGLATSKLAYDVKLNDGLDNVNLTAVLTREQAAQMALTAMKTPLVRYPDKGSTISVNGAVVSFGAREAEYVTSEIAKEQTISNQRLSNTKYYTIEFGEKYCPKLVLTYGNDAFGRPSYTWSYDKKKINSYLDYSDFVGEFTKKVTGRDLYDLIGSTVLKDGDVEIYIDGETEKGVLNTYGYFTKDNIIRSNTEGVGATGNGTLTQVFVDTSGERNKITIAIINTYLAKADADFNEKKNEATFDVWSIEKSGTTDKLVKNADNVNVTTGRTKAIKLSGEDFDLENVKKDDIVLVTVADETIQTIEKPEVVEGTTINAFKNGSWLKADGTQYDYASTAQYDVEVLDDYSQTNMKDTTYNVYLDPYGYAIGVEIVEAETKYVFLTGIDLSTSNLTNKTAEGNIIFLDGTIETVKINMDKSRNAQDKKFTAGDDNPAVGGTGVSSLMNTWCTYSVDKNGVYTLTEVANDNGNFDSKDKAGQSRNFATTGDDAKAWNHADNKTAYDALSGSALEAVRDVVTIDKKHVTLNGIASSAIVSKAYGNDQSIFLSADTDLITATNTPNSAPGTKTPAVVISGVTGISTGVRNTSLTAYSAKGVLGENSTYNTATNGVTLQDVSQGVYTLFSNKGYVIAAIVVGEDGGASSNYVYVTSEKASQEGYSNADDEWTWTREVILNGQKAEITEKGDSLSEIGHKSGEGNMTRGDKTYSGETGEWYKVTYKADGTVHEVESLTFVAGVGKYIKNITDVEASVDDEDTVILFADYTGHSNIITVQGNTLHVQATGIQTNHEGFAVAPDAKIALIQDTKPSNGNLKIMDKIYEYDNGTDGLAKAVKDMNDNENFKGYISAVFENGLATSVVIYDKTATGVNQGSSSNNNEDYKDGLKINVVALLDDNAFEVSFISSGTSNPTPAQRRAAVKAAYLANNSEYNDNDIDVKLKNGRYTILDENGEEIASYETASGSPVTAAPAVPDADKQKEIVDQIGDAGQKAIYENLLDSDYVSKDPTFTPSVDAGGNKIVTVSDIDWKTNLNVYVAGFFSDDGTTGMTIQEAYLDGGKPLDGQTIVAFAIVPVLKTNGDMVFKIVFKDNTGGMWFADGTQTAPVYDGMNFYFKA